MTQNLNVDPIPCLLDTKDDALTFFVRRDLLDEDSAPIENLWELPRAIQLIKKQKENGSWRYGGQGRVKFPYNNYDLLETFRNLRILVEMHGMNKDHPAILGAAEFVFSCQTNEGDFRGIIGNQYMPYYHGAICELLIKAGYADDSRVIKGLDWLLSVRQDDGGWLIPTQLVPPSMKTDQYWQSDPTPTDPSKPHAHLATGMALRAFAAHPQYRHRKEAKLAGERLKERFFKADKYNDRKAPDYWLKLQFPFWWTNLLTGLDSLSKLGFPKSDPDIQRGLDWFAANQEDDGLWPTGYGKGNKSEENRLWVGLAVCRVLKAFNIRQVSVSHWISARGGNHYADHHRKLENNLSRRIDRDIGHERCHQPQNPS